MIHESTKKLLAFSVLLLAVLLGSACSTSAITVGTVRPAIRPESVKLYLTPPARYEEIALINSNNAWGSPFGGQQVKVNTVVKRMKAQAAKLGANGLIIKQIGDQSVGAIGHSNWSGTVYGNTVTGFGSGMSTNMMLKIGSAVAIYVY